MEYSPAERAAEIRKAKEREAALTAGPNPTCCGIWRLSFAREPAISRCAIMLLVLWLLGMIPAGADLTALIASLWVVYMVLRVSFCKKAAAEAEAKAERKFGKVGGASESGAGRAHYTARDAHPTYLDHLLVVLAQLVVVNAAASQCAGGGALRPRIGRFRTYFWVIARWLDAVTAPLAMPGFFLVAGYAECGGVERHGREQFVASKCKRLGSVFLFVFFVVNPALVLVDQLFRGAAGVYAPIAAHAWFVLALVALGCLYSLVRAAVVDDEILPGLSYLTWKGAQFTVVDLLFSLPLEATGNATWCLVPVRAPALAFYVAAFAAGVQTRRNRWLEDLRDWPDGKVRRLRRVALGGVLWLGAVAHLLWALEPAARGDDDGAENERDDDPERLGWRVWLATTVLSASGGLLCPALVLAAVQLFQERFSEKGPVFAYCADGVYAVYLSYPLTNAAALYAYVSFYDATSRPSIAFRDDDATGYASTTAVGEGAIWGAFCFAAVAGLAVWPLAHYVRALPIVGGLL